MGWSSSAELLSTLSCGGHILFSRRRSASARAIFATLPTPRNATRVRRSSSESSFFSSSSSTSLPLQIRLAFQLRPLKNPCFWHFPEATITCPISALGFFLLQVPLHLSSHCWPWNQVSETWSPIFNILPWRSFNISPTGRKFRRLSELRGVERETPFISRSKSERIIIKPKS